MNEQSREMLTKATSSSVTNQFCNSTHHKKKMLFIANAFMSSNAIEMRKSLTE